MKLVARIASPSLVLGLVACVGVASCAAVPCSGGRTGAQDEVKERNGEVGVLIGARSFDENDWSPVDEQAMLGIEADWRMGVGGLGVEMGFGYSQDSGTVSVPPFGDLEAEATFLEFYGGVRQTFGNAAVRPYIGAGLTFIDADATLALGGLSGSDDDASLGGYVHAGVRGDVGRHVVLGVDVRGVFGTDLEIAGASTDADYFQAALFVGMGF